MARTNRELRKALLQKMDVSPQRLSQLVKKRKRELPMSTPEATYTIAFERDIDISKYLSTEETSHVRGLVAQLKSGATPSPAPRRGGKASGPKPALVTIGGTDIERLPGMTAAHAQEARMMSQKVYPMLYVFENSARDVISRVLQAAVGDDWWNEVVPKRVRESAEDKKADERSDPWHGRRGDALIDYTLLSQLPKIVSANDAWPHFEPLFDRKSWFEELVSDFNVSRRVVAHMNPLASDDIKNIEAAFRKWSKTLKARKDLLA